MPNIVKDISGAIVVRYPVRKGTQVITQGEYDLVRELSPTHYIRMIKFIRAQYHLGLLEAKNIVDTLRDSHEVNYTITY